jgi:WD40 repeat protein
VGEGGCGVVYVAEQTEPVRRRVALKVIKLGMDTKQVVARFEDTATWQEQATLRGFLESVNSAVFSPDDRRLATSGSNPSEALKLWDVASWQELLTLEGAGSLFALTAFSPDGNTIGTLSDDGILNVWRAPSWAEINAAEAKEQAEVKQP